jgi:hypothetical protein
VEDAFWPAGPSPWEVVDALFFPDLAHPDEPRVQTGFRGLPTCRGRAYLDAIRIGDPCFGRCGYS